MNILIDEHHRLLAAMNINHVRYLLVGGYAVIMHGYGRTTGDMDLWIEASVDNIGRLSSTLSVFGFPQTELEKLKTLELSSPSVFFIGKRPKRIDFMTHLNGIRFEEAWHERREFEINEIILPVINLPHLIITKISTGRPQDKADVEILQQIQNRRNKKN
jgi:hypothetical protein